MTVFLVYDDAGKIIQGNKLYDKPTPDYIDQMNAAKHRYIAVDRETLVQPNEFFIRDKTLQQMQPIEAQVSKKIIKAGGTDSVVIIGAPADCEYKVDVNIPGIGAVTTHYGKLPDGELEMGMDMPCLFTIQLSKFPFKAFSVQIEAIA